MSRTGVQVTQVPNQHVMFIEEAQARRIAAEELRREAATRAAQEVAARQQAQTIAATTSHRSCTN